MATQNRQEPQYHPQDPLPGDDALSTPVRSLGQLVGMLKAGGFRVLASPIVPVKVQRTFIQRIVYRYWDSRKPAAPGYCAIYLYQIALEGSLFGWLYSDRESGSSVPVFICYYLPGPLDAAQLDNILTCLHAGPVTLPDRRAAADSLENLRTPDLWSYRPVRPGVPILSTDTREYCLRTLAEGRLLDLFVPALPQMPAMPVPTPRPDETPTPGISPVVLLGVVATVALAGLLLLLSPGAPVDQTPLPPRPAAQTPLPPAPEASPSQVVPSPQSKSDPVTRSVPGLPTGVPISEVQVLLGQPTRSYGGYWPNTRAALYELDPNRITVAYLFDRDSNRVRQTEASFAQSIDLRVMRETLNGMSNEGMTRQIERGLSRVYKRDSSRYTFTSGLLEGVIERNSSDRIYMAVWEADLH